MESVPVQRRMHVNNNGRNKLEEKNFIRFMLAIIGTVTDDFKIGYITSILGPLFIILSSEKIHRYNLRVRTERQLLQNSVTEFHWKAWKTCFRSQLQELKIAFLIKDRRIVITLKQLEKVAWKLIKHQLNENEKLPIKDVLCYNCQTTSPNCKVNSCSHSLCLNCVCILKEYYVERCRCDIPITTITYFTKDKINQFEQFKTQRIYSFALLMKLFLIQITRNFKPCRSMTMFGEYLIDVACKHVNEKYYLSL